MRANITGRVANADLPLSHALAPVYEAVINAIHAIDAAGKREQGRIVVTVHRSSETPVMAGAGTAFVAPVESIQIEDNGIGFNASNFDSFETLDSRAKVSIGGKGIGRILWLKAFEWAEIDSTYLENGKYSNRRFRFTAANNGIEEHQLFTVPAQEPRTIVRLMRYRREYATKVPRRPEAIAKRIVDHCIHYLVLGACPHMLLVDLDTSERYDLNEIYRREVLGNTTTRSFSVGNREFKILHVQLAGGDGQHRLNFCADDRPVRAEALSPQVPDLLEERLKDTEQERWFTYNGYVSGAYLDRAVTAERTAFRVHDGMFQDDELRWEDVVQGAAKEAADFLAPYTEPARQQKDERIQTFVRENAPQFRHLLKFRPAAIRAIAANITDEKLELELYRIDRDLDDELRQRYQQLLADADPAVMDQEDYEQKLGQFLEEWNEVGMARLAKYVAHRKATLGFLESRRGMQETGRYALEDAIHKVIFPLRATSDEVPPDRMNLWIIDEKLAYHHYLASDRQLRHMAVLDCPSQDRPDLIIFNRPTAFVDSGPPFQSVVLIEFKRPARDNYSGHDNPIEQVYRYVRQIKEGRAQDRRGIPIRVPDHTPFYAYVIGDITPTLQEQADFAGFTPTPDGLGYFGYNKTLGIYVEIISFDKLLDDAQRRNAVLFDSLGLGSVVGRQTQAGMERT